MAAPTPGICRVDTSSGRKIPQKDVVLLHRDITMSNVLLSKGWDAALPEMKDATALDNLEVIGHLGDAGYTSVK
jgi:hypothetical protein